MESPVLHLTVQAAPFMRKSSVWVAQSWIGPGRFSRATEAAARRPHPSTRHMTGNSTVTMRPGIAIETEILSGVASRDLSPCRFLVLLLAALLFERLRRLLGHRFAGRLVSHVCPLSLITSYSVAPPPPLRITSGPTPRQRVRPGVGPGGRLGSARTSIGLSLKMLRHPDLLDQRGVLSCTVGGWIGR